MATPCTWLTGSCSRAEEAAQQNPELVGGAHDVGHQPPVGAQGLAVEQADGGLRVADVEGEEHAGYPAKVREPVRWRASWPAASATRSSPSRVMPAARPTAGSASIRPARDVALAPARQLVVAQVPARRGGAAQRRNQQVEHLKAGDAGTKPDAGVHVRGRDVQPDADGDPVGRGAAPAGLDEDARELSRADVEIVGPLHADRRLRQVIERLGGVEPTPEGEHVERAGVGGTLDQGEPDAGPGRGGPAPAMAAPSPRSARRRG